MTSIYHRLQPLYRLMALMLIGLHAFQPALAQDTPPADPVVPEVVEESAEVEGDWQEKFNAWFAKNINGPLGSVLFAPVPFIATDKVTENGEPVLDRCFPGSPLKSGESY